MDRCKIVRHNTEKLPNDLIIEVLSRLPAKSVAIFRCVSKQWDSLLASQVFKESFLTNSLSRPGLLFNFRFGSKWHFFSSPQPQKFGENFSIVAKEHHMGSYKNCYIESCQSVHGFIYLRYRSKEIDETTQVIYNPCTRQHITLPKLETRYYDMRSFFVYDPIQKQFKVLCTYMVRKQPTNFDNMLYDMKYQVLTLGSGELLWREIECSFPQRPGGKSGRDNGICINGVLYYKTPYANGNIPMQIICFDVSSEKFSFIKIEKDLFVRNLVNYKGKLGVVVCFTKCNGKIRGEVWVLDDTIEAKWSKHKFVLPDHAMESMLATDRGEIVWVSSPSTYPSYVFYYTMESKRVRRFELIGMEDKVTGKDRYEFHTSTNHVENLMFLYKKPGLIHGTIANPAIKSNQSIGEDMQDNLGTKRGDQAAGRRERPTKRGEHEVH
ncbi:hypothetical protein CARUB_v10010884mg [Capsella rubella]|uniref:F-box domain-containing protein n=1 Tax=Capsella rubella TaxID=81985 RepID=R0GS22_9BRAS|nr:hypothetical protein CARUB_v10010884mg [Capsella rubella]